jgi:hypothetical protein
MDQPDLLIKRALPYFNIEDRYDMRAGFWTNGRSSLGDLIPQ